MHQTPLLEGRVAPSETDKLRRENEELRRQLRDLEPIISEARTVVSGINTLRSVLTPLFRGLQQVFAELDSVGVSQIGASNATGGDAKAEVWEAWKQKLGKNCSRIITALQTHGPMNVTQIAMATSINRSNVPKSTYILNKAGLINKNGGVISLKQL